MNYFFSKGGLTTKEKQRYNVSKVINLEKVLATVEARFHVMIEFSHTFIYGVEDKNKAMELLMTSPYMTEIEQNDIVVLLELEALSEKFTKYKKDKKKFTHNRRLLNLQKDYFKLIMNDDVKSREFDDQLKHHIKYNNPHEYWYKELRPKINDILEKSIIILKRL